MLVNLFLILCAVKFFRTSIFMLAVSNTKNTCVNMISSILWILKASNDNPKSIPTKMKKNIFRIMLKFRESIAKGRK